MTWTGLEAFDTSVQKTHELLNDLMSALMIEDKRRAYIALKVVLHAVRDRLPVEEAVQFAGQFTLLLKGVYFEGWDPSGKPEKMSRKAFLGRVNSELVGYLDQRPEDVVKTVLEVISRKTAQNMSAIRTVLPEDYWGFIPESQSKRFRERASA